MTDFLLALALLPMLLFGHWIMSRLDRFLAAWKGDDEETE